jgi:type IV secretory pathway VirB3-like protein
MENNYFDPIYKGSTAPSTAFGVPLIPFILGTLVFAQLAVLGLFIFGFHVTIVCAILYGFALVWAQKVSRNDDQRLLQLLMKMRMRGPQLATRRYWGAVSFSPTASRK